MSAPAFDLIGKIDVASVLSALDALEDPFRDGGWRKRRSPHKHSETLTIFGPPTTRPRDLMESLEVTEIHFPRCYAFMQAIDAIADLAGASPARAMIVSLSPGGKVERHIDTGIYAEATERYHLPLRTNIAAFLEVSGEERNLGAGELWWINKHTPHSAWNDGASPRIHMIVDLWRAQ